MKKYCSFLFLTGSIMYWMSCTTPPNEKTTAMSSKDSSSFDLSKARSWIESDNAKFVEEVKKGDSAGLASHYASDALLMMPGMEPVKKDGIASAWGSVIRMGMKDVKVNTVDLTGDASMLVETGRFEMYGDNNKLLDKGKYVVVWKPENDGWKIYRDIGNTNMPEQHK